MKFAIDNVIDGWLDGITAAQVTEALAGLKDGETLELSINSPGGDVYEGIAIFNAIREVAKTHPVVVTINGLAASRQVTSRLQLGQLTAMKFLKTDLQMNLKNLQLQNKTMLPTRRLLKAVMRLS